MTEHDPILTVARAMTDVEPDAAVVQRVRVRIAATAPTSQLGTMAWRWALPTAAIASLVMVVVFMRPAPVADPVDAPQGTPIASNHTTPATSPTRPAIAPASVTSASSSRTRVARSEERTAAPSEAELEWFARSVPALDPIPPMVIAPLVVESTQPQPLSLPPLTITPLTMPPVHGEPDGGRRN